MTNEKSKHDQVEQQKQQQRKAATDTAHLASAKRNKAHDITQRALRQRQAKGLHQQDAK